MANKIQSAGLGQRNNLCSELKIIVLLTLFWVIAIPVVILLLPLFLIRFILSKVGPRLKPELGKILCAQSAFMAADNIYKDPQNSIVIWSIIQGEIDIGKIQDSVQKHWIESKRDDGEYKFPELQQFVKPWLGFKFWWEETEFDVKEHVKLRDLSFFNEAEILKLVAQVGKEGYPEGKSPWELIIYTNYSRDGGSQQGLQICRFHHALCDGFAVLKLFSCTSTIDPEAIIDSRTSQNRPAEGEKRNPWVTALKRVAFVLRAPYSFAKDMVGAVDTFSGREEIHVMANDWNCVMARDHVPISLVKEVKAFYQVGFQAVILAAVTGVWRKIMMREGGSLEEYIHVGIPFPSKHPDKLRNAWTMSALQLPIGESSPTKRLAYIEGQVRRLKRSGSLMIGEFAPRFIGCLPDALIRIAGRNRSIPAFASIMPGPLDIVHSYETVTNVKIGFFAPLLCGEAGLGFSAFSYQDEVVISLVADKAVLPELTQVQMCADSILEEIQELKDLMLVEV